MADMVAVQVTDAVDDLTEQSPRFHFPQPDLGRHAVEEFAAFGKGHHHKDARRIMQDLGGNKWDKQGPPPSDTESVMVRDSYHRSSTQ